MAAKKDEGGASSARREFTAELLDGHKGPAVLVPFDPAAAWGIPATPIPNEVYGTIPGHRVRASFNGHRFEGWIGIRRGIRFILADAALRKAAGIAVGDPVRVRVEPLHP